MVVISFKGKNIDLIKVDGYFGVYDLGKLSEKYVLGYHSTIKCISDSICKSGFDAKQGTYFAVGLNSITGGRYIEYARHAALKIVNLLIQKMVCSKKNYQDLIRDIVHSKTYNGYGIGNFVPNEFANLPHFKGVIIEALIPFEKICNTSTGEVRDGKFYGYEALISNLKPSYILRISSPFYVFKKDDILKISINKILDLFDGKYDLKAAVKIEQMIHNGEIR